MRRCAKILPVLGAKRSYRQAWLAYVGAVAQRYLEATAQLRSEPPNVF
jgi:hypothetical protein